MTRLEWNYEWTPHSTTRVLYKRARCGRLRYLLLSANKIPVQRFAHVLIRLSLWRRHFLGSITSWLTIQKVVPSIVRYLYPTFSFISNSTCALTSFLLILFPIIHLVFPTILAVATFYSTNNNVLYFFFFRSFKGFFSSLSILFDFSKRKKKILLCTNDRCTFDNSLAKSSCSFVTRNLALEKPRERIFPENRSLRHILHF